MKRLLVSLMLVLGLSACASSNSGCSMSKIVMLQSLGLTQSANAEYYNKCL